MASESSSNLAAFQRHLAGEPGLSDAFSAFAARAQDFDLDLLLEEVDSSDYSACDWAAALLEFDRWLEDGKIALRPFPQMIGYVHCCTLMNAPQIHLPSLKVIVSQSLTEFGFEAVSKTQF